MDNKTSTLPLIPLRGLTIFPSMVLHFDVGREKSIEAVDVAMLNDEDIFLAVQKKMELDDPTSSDISNIGTICKIKQIIKMPGDTIRVLVEGKSRGKIKKYIENDKYFEVVVDKIDDGPKTGEDDVELDGYFKSLKKAFKKFIKEAGEEAPDISIKYEKSVYKFINVAASYVPMPEEKKQEILETMDIKKRVEMLLIAVEKEIEVIKVQKRLANKMKKSVDDSQKEYYLREQLKFIQEELGEDDEEKVIIDKFEEKINKGKLPKDVKEKAINELGRLRRMNISSSEGNTVQSYLEWLLDIPWGKYTKEVLDIKKAEEVLNLEHYGLEDVKERILEYLAVKKMSGSLKGPILCLVGPPGVGKTSIARSIAKAINRKYVRMSLGGLKDESEIRGHRRTYVAAIPGRIVYGLKEAKSLNPLILLDEIDKLSTDYKGNPADALLEVLDSEQNKTFRDNFIELPIDLSKALFITTANNLDTIPRPLLDRMEIVEVSGYTYEEKFHIAKNHLIPKIFDEYKIEKDKIIIKDDAIKEIIDGYTRESGVRSLERGLGKLVRKAIAEMLKDNKESISINKKKVEKLMGNRIFTFDEIKKEDKLGVVTGLAWTAYGGDTLPVEAMVMDGSGKLQLTGKLGEVMQESAKAAYSYVRSNAVKYGIKEDFYKEKDIHIHVPEGAVPKDGPSAGVTMVTALVSALSGKKVKGNIAMTGEVTLTGRVLPIGGLKEKSLAAFRAGVDTIIIPKENAKDVEKIPSSIRNKIKIIKAEEVGTVLENALIGECTNDN
ncbi:endopeptidase La [Clostridium sp. SHJSY1]|uniref:endopeptidase La n=1 Tax=Clostridium sp. SHJSY1 TaxID=2942483 RepID=UPI002874DDBD|nr:endopeptidase La [Clostridium sp. SHJSY1]MDS0525047.1 endopeptidase La [Clostridium sp. SHJSY1]